MRILSKQTRAERIGGVDGLTLFFGALLGANLGTIQSLPIEDYIQLIVLLAGAVIAIRLISLSERKANVLWTVAFFAAILAAIAAVPALRPDGLPEEALHRIFATIGIWVAAVLLVEFWPQQDDPDVAIPAAHSDDRPPEQAPPPGQA